MRPTKIEKNIRGCAGFAEAGSDLMDNPSEKREADSMFDGANWIRSNAKLISHSHQLLSMLEQLLENPIGARQKALKLVRKLKK